MPTERRVLRWDVPINDEPTMIGGGRVVHVGCRADLYGEPGPTRRVEVWTEELLAADLALAEFDTIITRKVLVVGTAQAIPDRYDHVGSAIDPDPRNRLVWHLYQEVRP